MTSGAHRSTIIINNEAGDVLDAPDEVAIESHPRRSMLPSFLAEQEKFITPPIIRNQLCQSQYMPVRRRLDEAGLFGRVARISWPLTQDVIDEHWLSLRTTLGGMAHDWASCCILTRYVSGWETLVKYGCRSGRCSISR